VELALTMPVQRVVAHPRIAATTGRVALMRGPLVYCVEGVDHPGVDLRDVVLPSDAAFETQREDDLLGGVVALYGQGRAAAPGEWDGSLYRLADTVGSVPEGDQHSVPLFAVPYYAWANRDPGQMQVWLRTTT
jgi:DUF1680 family protein